MNLYILFLSLICVVQCKKLGIRVIRHQPCRAGNGAHIIFDGSDKAPVKEDPAAGEGCYKLHGTVKVEKELKGSINLYVESKNGTRAEPIECKNANEDGCGGLGSCIFCDACGALKKEVKNDFQLLSDGKPIDCKSGLKPGTYSNIALNFCAPDEDEFLRLEHIDRKAWDELIGSKGTTIYMVIHIFDTAVNKLSKAELNAAIASEIGCHKLVLNVYSR